MATRRQKETSSVLFALCASKKRGTKNKWTQQLQLFPRIAARVPGSNRLAFSTASVHQKTYCILTVDMSLYMDELSKESVRMYGALFWSFIWIFLIVLPPGSKAIATSYRLNFTAGLLATVSCILVKYDVFPESFATASINTYFFIDLINILINDFVFKVPSYQSPQNRKMEYFHHVFCLFFGLCSEFTYHWVCTFDHNPYVEIIIYSEFSTPFLMAWRYTNSDILGIIFFAVFVICRLYFLGVFVLPDCIRHCHPYAGWGFSIPYYSLNFYFVYMMIRKVIRKVKNGKKSDKEK